MDFFSIFKFIFEQGDQTFKAMSLRENFFQLAIGWHF